MSIIISGGAGFIGINLIRELLKRKLKIFIIDNFSNGKKSFIKSIKNRQGVNIIECDLSNEISADKAINQVLKNSISEPEIWHLAANSDIPSGTSYPKIDLRDTFMTTFNLLEMSRIYGIKKFYFASSSAVYGNHGNNNINENTGPMMPISNYGAMKLASEAQCFSAYESYLEDLRVFRFPNVVGVPATHGVILDFINKLKKNPKKLNVLGDGNQQKSYLHVSDLVSAMVFLSKVELDMDNSPIFNLGPEKDTVKVSWIAEQVVKKVSPNAEIIYGGDNRGWVGDVPKFSYDTTKAQKFGWKPKLNSEESISKAIEEIIQELD
tara:strand:+ start:11145 stop:12113 length:969 start_codon:yes stop_codon:yes gene_type:complete